ncbi:MAG: hypothetical protein H0T40_07205 [Geodermatophilaceae bacterium]|nr:hypothetical protein [Geodermatophilaceae bacterium]
MWSVYVGEKLGLYAALAQRETLTGAELAAAAQIDPRYATECSSSKRSRVCSRWTIPTCPAFNVDTSCPQAMRRC